MLGEKRLCSWLLVLKVTARTSIIDDNDETGHFFFFS
jgi:hypothetical protein